MADEQARIVGKAAGEEIAKAFDRHSLKDILRSMKSPFSSKSALEQIGYAIGIGLKDKE